jgi:hypothetical protein
MRGKQVVKLRRLFGLGGLSFIVGACHLFAPACQAQSVTSSRVNVSLVTDEAEAVLAILDKKRANRALTEADWQRLFGSEGYVRLKRREAAMRRPFTDDDFKSFVLGDKPSADAPALSETLKAWERASVRSGILIPPQHAPVETRSIRTESPNSCVR